MVPDFPKTTRLDEELCLDKDHCMTQRVETFTGNHHHSMLDDLMFFIAIIPYATRQAPANAFVLGLSLLP